MLRVARLLPALPACIGPPRADGAGATANAAQGSGAYMATAAKLIEVDDIGSGDRDYRPFAAEEFMNPRQQAYFRRKLLDWKDAILRESRDTLAQLQVESLREPDVTDRASTETDWGIELRTRDRQRKLICKIEAAIRRIDQGEYGYCEVTGEPISLARLEARPVATMTVDAQERHERNEKVSRDE
jgi:DnaK suppressor protein